MLDHVMPNIRQGVTLALKIFAGMAKSTSIEQNSFGERVILILHLNILKSQPINNRVVHTMRKRLG